MDTTTDIAVTNSEEQMASSAKSWGRWILVWAVLSVILGNPYWGAVLLVVSAISFYFSDIAAMFLVYASVMSWAALSNLLSFEEPFWMFMGGLQVVWAVQLFREYQKYRKAVERARDAPAQSGETEVSGRRARMGWVALLLGAIGVTGLCSLVPAMVAEYYLAPKGLPEAVYMVIQTALELGVLAVPLGVAAILSGYQPRGPAIIGTVLGVVCLLGYLAAMLLSI